MLVLCAPLDPLHAQHGLVRREQEISGSSGGFSGEAGNDFRFGVSTAALGDFDGDGTPDVAVGAHRANRGGSERGAVWLCLLQPDGTVKAQHEISSVAGGFTGTLDDRDRFGISVCSLGDLDGDGTTDLAVGAYHDDDGGSDVGAVWILFLDPLGSVRAHQKISALEGGFPLALRSQDSFGWAVESIGDLDGDGVQDLAVGATRDDNGGSLISLDYGAVYLCFLRPDGTVRAARKLGAGTPLLGPALRQRDRFGSDVCALGDANGDGFGEIAVGAFSDEPGMVGRVFVLGIRSDGSLASQREIGLGKGGFTGALDLGDRFGISLAADDLDGDGVRDLFVGAPGDDDGGMDAGAIWACLLAGDGAVRATEKVNSRVGGFGGAVQANDWFGVSCASLGDVDGDGATDLAAGAYQADDGGYDRGAVWILFRWGGTDLPAAEFAAEPSQGSAPLSVLFTDHSAGLVTSWLWDFGDGALSSAQHPAHTYTIQGSYSVKLTVGGPLGRDELTRARQIAVVGSATPPVADFQCSPSSGEAPLLVRFQDMSTGDATAWLWDFGDGSTSTSSSPEHAFASVGTYDVSLTVAGPGGADTKVANDLITVREPAPVAAFSATPTSGPAPLAVSFTDQSTLNVTSWRWDFGDGSTASVRSPQHVYAAPGLYTVALAVTSAGGTSRLARTNLVNVTWPPPEAAFSASPTDGPAPLAVTFTDQSTGAISSWSWSFGDGAGSSTRNPVHSYALPGSYKVTLKVAGPGGSATRTRPKFVTVSEAVLAADFAGTPTSGTYPLTVSFTNLSTGSITSHAWRFGDGGTSTLASPSHIYAAAGSYTVTLTETGPGGTSSRTRAGYVVVSEPPPVALFAAAPTTGVAPLTVAFTDQSTGSITSHAWRFGDGATSTLASPSHTYAAAGSYTVTLTETGPGGTGTNTRAGYVVVSEPAPVALFAAAPTTGVAPLTVAFTDQSTGSITSHEWRFGDGATSTLASPSHTYAAAGSYTVTLTETGPGGTGTRTRAGYVVVSEPAPVALFAAAPTTGVAPLTVAFTDQSTGSITAWTWDFGDGTTSTAQQPLHAYLAPGNYTVMLTVAGPGGTGVLRLADLVQATEPPSPPEADFTASPVTGVAPLTVSFQDLSSGTVSRWEWTFGDGTSSRLQSPSHVYRLPGKYSVRLRTAGPAGSDEVRRLDYIRVVDLKDGDVQQSPHSPAPGATSKGQ